VWRQGLYILSEAHDEVNLKRLVNAIAETGAVPLRAVIQILKKHGFATVETIMPLVKVTFDARQRTIAEMQVRYREPQVLKSERLADDFVYEHFVARATRCARCDLAISLPGTHFLCGHSYHTRCLGDDLTKCQDCLGR